MSFFSKLFGGTSADSGARPDAVPAGVPPEDHARLVEWVSILRAESAAEPSAPFGRLVARAGELTVGSPYAFRRLDTYLTIEETPGPEPMALSLTHFEAVTLVESCVALARCSRAGTGTWDAFGREVEQTRYRGGTRGGYLTRLHYFTEWMSDNAARGLLRDVTPELGGVRDPRQLRYMSTHRSSYPALRSETLFSGLVQREQALDSMPRFVVPHDRVAEASAGIQSGDILGFATAVRGLDVSHAGIAYRDERGALRVLQALFSASKVEISTEALPEYVAGRKASGILVARPL